MEGSPDVGGGDGSDGDSKSPRRGEIAAARRAVAEVEEILDGEIQDPRRVDQIISEQHWEGPLPPPAALAAYERVLPGAADRAFTLAERNLDVTHMRAQTVRIAVEGEVAVQTITAEADRDALKRGQYLAAGISGLIGALSFGGLFLTPWAAIGFAVPLAQVAGALIRTVSDRRTPSDRGDEPPPNQGPSSELERSPGS
ncbi:MAG: DUF2335 domain-containing protein [Actinomycetia bacterium]|nr:DUF2335 domain-containing protein [Actinomycetes bacterium]